LPRSPAREPSLHASAPPRLALDRNLRPSGSLAGLPDLVADPGGMGAGTRCDNLSGAMPA